MKQKQLTSLADFKLAAMRVAGGAMPSLHTYAQAKRIADYLREKCGMYVSYSTLKYWFTDRTSVRSRSAETYRTSVNHMQRKHNGSWRGPNGGVVMVQGCKHTRSADLTSKRQPKFTVQGTPIPEEQTSIVSDSSGAPHRTPVAVAFLFGQGYVYRTSQLA